MSVEAISSVVSIPALGVVKMEDRKRNSPSDGHHDDAPPLKRAATTHDVKTSSLATSDANVDMMKFGTEGSPWQVELETFQKDALIRNLREFKREKTLLEAQVADSEKRSQSNEDAIRFVESFVTQFIDEIRVFTGKIEAVDIAGKESTIFALTSASSPLVPSADLIQKQLSSRLVEVQSAIKDCLAKLPPAPPESRQLQQKLNEVLGTLKAERKKLDTIRSEKDALQTGLESATERYLKAEKRMDRMRSNVLTNLEKQGRMPNSASQEKEQVNGETTATAQVDSGALQEFKIAKEEAVAESTKRKEQVEKLESENAKLTTELTSLTTRLASLSDDDYAKTDIFKASKIQHEDLIKRINHLEATHIQLREEAKKLREDRLAYRKQVEDEAQKTVEESEAQLSRLDADLQRIRQERDALQDKYNVVKASKTENRETLERLEEMSQAKDARISAFQEEVARLRISSGAATPQNSTVNDIDAGTADADELRIKYSELQKKFVRLEAELPQMETAYTKYYNLSMKKVSELQAYEDRITLLTAEKQKADQKFFGAMKIKDAVEAKNKTLQEQTKQTGGLISAYKAEIAAINENNRNLEKQIAEYQSERDAMTYKEQVLQSAADTADAKAKALDAGVTELRKALETKDTATQAAQQSQREAEVELEKTKVSIVNANKLTEQWKKKAKGNSTEEIESLRRVAYCTSCHKHLKNTMLKTCGHLLCKECVDERIASRSRKCPHCLKPFGINDHVPVHLI